METPANKLHPMILVAATAVTVTSLAALAALFGWLPVGQHAPAASTAPAPLAMQAPAPTTGAPPAPAAAGGNAAPLNAPPASNRTVKPATEHRPAPPHARASAPQHAAIPPSEALPPPPPARGATPVAAGYGNDNGIYVEDARAARPAPAAQPAYCRDCGTVESVREVKHEAQGTGLGAVAGTLLGGVVGNQMGKGNGNTAMTVLGAVGGAFAGNEVEKNVRGTKQYEIVVRLDDGGSRVLTQPQAPIWHSGDRVRIVNGAVAPL